MRRYQLLILILLIGSTVITSQTQSNHAEMLVEDQINTNMVENIQSWNQSENINITTYGRGEIQRGQELRSSQDKIFTRELDLPSKVRIERKSAYQDKLQYTTGFESIWEQGSWVETLGAENITTNYSSLTHQTHLEVVNGTGFGVFEVPISMNVGLDSFLEFNVDGFQLDRNSTVSGYMTVKFDFDLFDINIIYDVSDDMRPIFQNNTENNLIYYYNLDHKPFRLDFKEYLENSNKTSLELEFVTFNIYLTEISNLDMNISAIKLMDGQTIAPLVIDNETQEINNTLILDLEQHEQIQIHTIPDWRVDLGWVQYFNITQNWTGIVDVVNEKLLANITYTGDRYLRDIWYYLPIAGMVDRISEMITSNLAENGTHIYFEGNNWLTVGLRGELRLEHTWNIPHQIYQGREVDLTQSNTTKSLIIGKHEQEKRVVQFLSNNNAHIPLNWSKGNYWIWVLHKQGLYEIFQGELHLSPARVISTTEITILQTKKYNIPVLLENITSGETIEPDLVISTSNNRSREIDGRLGIFIETGEFHAGKVSLEINATRSGFIPVVYELKLEVLPIEINPQFHVLGRTSNSTTLQIIIPELDTWDLGINIGIEGFATNNTEILRASDTTLTLYHRKINPNTSMQLNISLVVEGFLAQFTYLVEIEPLTSNNSGSVIGVTVFGGITMTMIWIGYRLYQSKQSDNVINF